MSPIDGRSSRGVKPAAAPSAPSAASIAAWSASKLAFSSTSGAFTSIAATLLAAAAPPPLTAVESTCLSSTTVDCWPEGGGTCAKLAPIESRHLDTSSVTMRVALSAAASAYSEERSAEDCRLPAVRTSVHSLRLRQCCSKVASELAVWTFGLLSPLAHLASLSADDSKSFVATTGRSRLAETKNIAPLLGFVSLNRSTVLFPDGRVASQSSVAVLSPLTSFGSASMKSSEGERAPVHSTSHGSPEKKTDLRAALSSIVRRCTLEPKTML
mmetsp:Transcript_39572/g.92498  ORF Transcript_39572/g.92498 Transcript_39572/m.92498 type:complete len:270 (-) Transcript_39572:174-983(-)